MFIIDGEALVCLFSFISERDIDLFCYWWYRERNGKVGYL